MSEENGAAVEPTERQIAEMAELARSPDDGPLVMLNLNKYRDRAAYERYGAVALQVLERVGRQQQGVTAQV